MIRPDFSESVGGVDESADDVKPQHDLDETRARMTTSTTALSLELGRVKKAMEEIRREALRARARLESEPGAVVASIEHIALAAGATLNDLRGPREGRWPTP